MNSVKKQQIVTQSSVPHPLATYCVDAVDGVLDVMVYFGCWAQQICHAGLMQRWIVLLAHCTLSVPVYGARFRRGIYTGGWYIGSHELEASMRVTNAIHLGSSPLSVGTVNCVQTRKVAGDDEHRGLFNSFR
jgi:hypothetical protein